MPMITGAAFILNDAFEHDLQAYKQFNSFLDNPLF